MTRCEISGKKFSRLTPEEFTGGFWKCLCDCGNRIVVKTNKLTSGHTRSCGCLLADMNRDRLMTHGHKVGKIESLTYKVWVNMKTRCLNPNASNYPRYGGSGVTICEEWKNSFESFVADVGLRPSKGHSIERKDVMKGYEPNNCCWIPLADQNLNKKNTIYVDIDGSKVRLAEACRSSGVKYATAHARIKSGRAWNGVRT